MYEELYRVDAGLVLTEVCPVFCIAVSARFQPENIRAFAFPRSNCHSDEFGGRLPDRRVGTMPPPEVLYAAIIAISVQPYPVVSSALK